MNSVRASSIFLWVHHTVQSGSVITPPFITPMPLKTPKKFGVNTQSRGAIEKSVLYNAGVVNVISFYITTFWIVVLIRPHTYLFIYL